MATTFKLFADKMGGTSAASYIGTTGEIFWDQAVGALRVSDGVTVGGKPVELAEASSQIPVTSTYYVDAYRTDSYTETGSIITPYKTLASAYTAAVASGHNDSNPAYIALTGNITESITLTQGGIWLTSAYGTGTHGSPNINGTITINGSGGSLSANHFSISNLRIIPTANTHGIISMGSNPQKLFMRDIWIDANASKTCLMANNTGSGSTSHINTAHLTHSGSGDVYCIDATAGAFTITDIETSGNVQVIAVRSGATATIDSSEIDANNSAAIEVYGGTIVVTNSIINNTQANSNGIALNTAGSVATVGNCLFNIPAGTGKAVYGVAGTFLYSAYVAFYPATNTAKSSTGLTAGTLATAFT